MAVYIKKLNETNHVCTYLVRLITNGQIVKKIDLKFNKRLVLLAGF